LYTAWRLYLRSSITTSIAAVASRREVDRLVAHVASYIVEPASRQANGRLVKVAVFLPLIGAAAVQCARFVSW
jgi:hypothetical protein